MALFILLLCLFTIITSTISQILDFDTPFFENEAREFLYLNLVEDLSNAKEKFKTLEGRAWLNSWETKRKNILNNVLLYVEPITLVHRMYPNWRERLQRFYELQQKHLNFIVDKFYDKSQPFSPWPRIIFDEKKEKLL